MTDAAVSDPTDSGKVRLLVWDDPDVRARTADVLVAEAPADAGPNLERVYLWLLGRCAPSESPEACWFTTVRRGEEESVAAQVTKVRLQGFAVLARPDSGGSNLTAAMLAHVERVASEGKLTEVVVASHDAGGLAGRLATLASRGVAVTVLGFRERASYAVGRDGISFVDLEDVPGAYTATLPRTNLFDLPLDGRALPPLRLPQLPALNPAPQVVPIPPTPAPIISPAIAAPPPPAPEPATVTDSAPAATAPWASETATETESAPAPAAEPTLAPFPPAPPVGLTDRLPAGLPTFAAPPPAPVETPAAPAPTPSWDAPAPAPAPAAAPAAAEPAAPSVPEPEPAKMAPPPPPPPAPPVPPWRTTSPVTATPINPGGDDNGPRPGRVSPPNGL